jgi:hypothetical protein
MHTPTPLSLVVLGVNRALGFQILQSDLHAAKYHALLPLALDAKPGYTPRQREYVCFLELGC